MTPHTRFTPRRIRRLIATLMLVALSAFFALPAFVQQSGGNYVLHPTVIPGGGGSSANGSTTLSGSIGQPVLGSSAGGAFSLSGGFWQAASPCAAPAISAQPANQTACAGASASFSVTASGSGLTFQWRKDGTNLSNGGPISGAQSATLVINPATASAAASYDVVLTGPCGNLTSNAATLTVNAYSLSSMGQSFPAAGGTGSINVLVAGACPWTAVSNDSFITITAGSSGSGNGTVNYTVANNTGAARTGTMTVAGLTFTVNQSAPTLVELLDFTAGGYERGVHLQWRTGFEASNLGFRLYRDEGGERRLCTAQLIAGSALATGAVALSAGYAYQWWDASPASPTTRYWLEDVDLDGQSRWHGPFAVQAVGGAPPAKSNAGYLGSLGGKAAAAGITTPPDRARLAAPPTAGQMTQQAEVMARGGVKLHVRREGWYRVEAADLIAAGLDAHAEPRLLQLHAEGRMIPLSVETDKHGDLTAIGFYGTGIDAAHTDTRVYWLSVGSGPGLRLPQVEGAGGPAAPSFLHTVERRDRTVYFAALRNGERENFFGAAVTGEPVNQSLTTSQVEATANGPARLAVALQGVTHGGHRVSVYFNEEWAGEVRFDGQANATASFAISQSQVREGGNQVRLVAQDGAGDVSLVDYIRLGYWRSLIAEHNALRMTVAGNQTVTVEGFTTAAIRVFDVTAPDAPQELMGKVEATPNGYRVTAVPAPSGERVLVAIGEEAAAVPARIGASLGSRWRDPVNRADLVIIAHPDLLAAVEPLRRLRQDQGLKVEVASVEALYDEFSFGCHSPQALRDFLQYAKANWKQAPRFVLLVGDASYDPKNYLGLADWDQVPTKLVATDYLETASDDWLADFDGDGLAELAVGRLPARTREEAAAMVGKLIKYEEAERATEAVLVADRNDGFDFEAASAQLKPLMGGGLRVTEVRRGAGEMAAKQELMEALKRGPGVVNYVGHGNLGEWRGELLTTGEASGLANRPGLYVMMTCLNGYFHEAAAESLAEALLKAAGGGAVAVWASTGMTQPEGQATMNRELMRQLFSLLAPQEGRARLGEAIQRAKAATRDGDVRRTWVLLGDPCMRLRLPPTAIKAALMQAQFR